eukprot:3630402-Prymnesium_polylepis.2
MILFLRALHPKSPLETRVHLGVRVRRRSRVACALLTDEPTNRTRRLLAWVSQVATSSVWRHASSSLLAPPSTEVVGSGRWLHLSYWLHLSHGFT